MKPYDPKLVVEVKMNKIEMVANYHGISKYILLSVAEKKSVKEACDVIKMMCMVENWVKVAKMQTLKDEFEYKMKEKEQLEDYNMKLNE